MTQPHPTTDWSSDSHREPGDDWQALRADLVSLLEQVDRGNRPERRQAPKARGEGASYEDDRRQEALRSVRRAVERFTDPPAARGYPAESDYDLASAIQQIRASARQDADIGSTRDNSATKVPLHNLTDAVHGITRRLESLEGEVRFVRQSGGDISEVTSQLSQLTHVVELLAGAVGETGQVKRLEGQLANIARMVGEGQSGAASALSRRIDELVTTVDRLAELQAANLSHGANEQSTALAHETLGAVHAQHETLSVQGDALHSIEASVLNVYDRIDAIERSVSFNPHVVERITQDIGAVRKALEDGGNAGAPGGLLSRIGALSARVRSLEKDGPEPALDGLKLDVSKLHDLISQVFDNRFSAIESHMRSLGHKMDSVSAKPDLALVETQIRHLIEQMDKTGKQISGLQGMFAGEKDTSVPPNFEELAALVAKRTSEHFVKAMGKDPGVTPQRLDALEQRLSQMFSQGGSRAAVPGLTDVQSGIIKVDERLAKLEQALSAKSAGADSKRPPAGEQRQEPPRDAAPTAPAPKTLFQQVSAFKTAPEMPATQDKPSPVRTPATPDAGATSSHHALSAESEDWADQSFRSAAATDGATGGLAAKNKDLMPFEPTADNPLNDFSAKIPDAQKQDWSELKAIKPSQKEPLPASTAKPVDGIHPRIDFDIAPKPSKPRSSFDSLSEEAAREGPSTGLPVRPSAPDERTTGVGADRNTFIAAARRAAQAGNSQATPDADSQSLIGRAFARIQNRGQSGDAAVAAENPAKPVVDKAAAKAARAKQKAAKKSEQNAERASRADRAKVEPTKKPAVPAGDADVTNESFLSRHRRPILLVSAFVAVSLMTLNLVMQRTRSIETASANATMAPAEPGFTPEPMLDPQPTGSVDPFIKMDLTKPSSVAQPMPLGPQQSEFASRSLLDPVMTRSTTTSNAETFESAMAPAPFKLELPPEALGPLALREAAANGDARAQFEVAAIYSEGRAVGQDYKLSAVWYERSAAQGYAPAEYRMGNLYEYGNGVDKDLSQARLWYTRAAESGNRMAMHNLAALYASGALGDQKFDLAALWFEKAANFGMTDSQFNLGMLFARGLGVPQDLTQSYKWFSLAARSGDADAAKARDDVAKSLTAEVMQSTQTQIDAWKISPIEIKANFAPLGTWSPDFDPGQTILDAKVIERVQAALNRLGYEVGVPDGVMGPKTTEAIKVFENATGMNSFGVINPRLLAVLGSQPV